MVLEAKGKKSVRDIPVKKVWQAVHRANLRLQLHVIGETHKLLVEFLKQARGSLTEHAKSDGTLDGLGLYRTQGNLEHAWHSTFADWKEMFRQAQRDAASIPFGALAVYHNEMVVAAVKSLTEASFTEAEYDLDYVFDPQLQAVIDAANGRLYDDGLNLSQRIWLLDHKSYDGIRGVVSAGAANGDSAWTIAKGLESYLGANQDCPRWTASRLAELSKKDIAAGDRTGLLSGTACDGGGVAYNSLRLARTELQYASALATDRVMERMPWIEKEEVHLSPGHGERDVCDGKAGVHPKGEVNLPLHPHCLCYKTAVLMGAGEFSARLGDWMRGDEPWSEMDQYQQSIGGDVTRGLNGAVFAVLPAWL